MNPVRALTLAERTALRESIEAHGRILVPILVDQHGVIIDGHHRKAIADELGIDCPTDQITVATDVERMAVAIECNTARRQLGLHERTELHGKLRAAGWSLRRIAETTGASPQTVMRDAATVPDGTVPDRIVGLDGKSRPSTRSVSSFTPGRGDAGPGDGFDAGPDDDVPTRTLDPTLTPKPARTPEVDAEAEAIERYLDDQPEQKRLALRNAVLKAKAALATVVADISPEVAADLVDADERQYEVNSVSRQIVWLNDYCSALKRSGLTVMKGGRE